MGNGGSGIRWSTGGDARFGRIKELPLAGQTDLRDTPTGTQASVQGTLDKWEGKNNGLDHEQLLMINEDGFAVGYFDGGKDSVAFYVPTDPLTGKPYDTSKLTITHIHPAMYDRTIGGTFSTADLANHIKMNAKETRATSTEGTYSFKAGAGADKKGMIADLKKYNSETSRLAKEGIARLTKQGYTFDEKAKTDFFLKVSDMWLRVHRAKHGYEYRFIPRS